MSTAHQPIPPKKAWYLRPWAIALGVVLALLFLGALLGGNDAPTTAAPAPTVTATKTVEVEKPGATKTVTREVEKVPASCLKALDHADRGFDLAGQALAIVGEAFEAVGNFDVAEINRQTERLDKVTQKLGPVGDRYVAEKEECRAAAE